MENNPLDKRKPNQEQLDVKVRIATSDEWQECKDLRLLSISGPEAKMMGLTPEREKEERNKTEQEWREETNSSTMFSVLAHNNSIAVGLGRAREVEKGLWRIRNGYVKPEFRYMGIQQKMLALRLSEVINRGGVKAITGIRTDNPISIHNVEKFGFRKIGLVRRVIKLGRSALEWHQLEVDLTNPQVVKKIKEALEE